MIMDRQVQEASFKSPAETGAVARDSWHAPVLAKLLVDPSAMRIQCDTVDAFAVPDFLSAAQCDRLIEMIDEDRFPSKLMSDHPDLEYRNSESCSMTRWVDEVSPIDQSIADLLGIPLQNSEFMEGQRYAPGQHFHVHHDFFHHTDEYWQSFQERGGQRTWTAMMYLNNVEEGGATWFPSAGFGLRPQRGLLLAWCNLNPDGTPNVFTAHEGQDVTKGVKYIVTKWFREMPWQNSE